MPSWVVDVSRDEFDFFIVDGEDEEEAWKEAEDKLKQRHGPDWHIDYVTLKEDEPIFASLKEPIDAKQKG